MCEWQGGKPWRGMKVKALALSGTGCLGRRAGPPLVQPAPSVSQLGEVFMSTTIRDYLTTEEDGIAMVEYVLLLGGIVVLCLPYIAALGNQIAAAIDETTDLLRQGSPYTRGFFNITNYLTAPVSVQMFTQSLPD